MKKKVLSFILVTMLVVMMLPMSAYAASESDFQQDQLVEAYNNIIENFSKDESGQYIYPNEYAGAYIENGLLNICLTEDNDEIRNKYLSESGSPESIQFVIKGFNLNYLNNLADQVRNIEGEDILTVAVIQKSNSVDVGTNKDVNQVKNDILSALPVTFNNTLLTLPEDIPLNVTYQNLETSIQRDDNTYQVQPYAIPTLMGGLAFSSNQHGFTLGICGKYNGNSAILTCGHSQQVGKSVTVNGSVIGSIVKVNWSSSGYYDYAIIQLNSNAAAKVTNKVKTQSGTQTITSINKSSVEGMKVNRYGKTSGFKTGTVLATNISTTLDGVVCYGLVEVSADSTPQPGDSGGPVYYGSNFYGTVTGYNTSGVWFYSPSGAVPGFSL